MAFSEYYAFKCWFVNPNKQVTSKLLIKPLANSLFEKKKKRFPESWWCVSDFSRSALY